MLNHIAFAAWRCADPGTQYDTTINEWHTSPEGARIRAANPCSRDMFPGNPAFINLRISFKPQDIFN
ncbi:MAG: hypothetical protein KF746_18010 [Chitinophagaceae bacterium]|nr:hypothetical protein [Chitinophagaceae bacterium]